MFQSKPVKIVAKTKSKQLEKPGCFAFCYSQIVVPSQKQFFLEGQMSTNQTNSSVFAFVFNNAKQPKTSEVGKQTSLEKKQKTMLGAGKHRFSCFFGFLEFLFLGSPCFFALAHPKTKVRVVFGLSF